MLQLEKLKILPNQSNESLSNNETNRNLDFFKTSKENISKSGKIKKVLFMVPLLFGLSLVHDAFLEAEKEEQLMSDFTKANELHEQITNDLIKYNTLSVSSFEELTKIPSSYGMSEASMIVIDILFRDIAYQHHKKKNDKSSKAYKNYKILDPNIQAQVFKIYAQNWDYGMNKELELKTNCNMNILCHLKKNEAKKEAGDFNKFTKETISHTLYPEIFEKNRDLIKLKMKHNVLY